MWKTTFISHVKNKFYVTCAINVIFHKCNKTKKGPISCQSCKKFSPAALALARICKTRPAAGFALRGQSPQPRFHQAKKEKLEWKSTEKKRGVDYKYFFSRSLACEKRKFPSGFWAVFLVWYPLKVHVSGYWPKYGGGLNFTHSEVWSGSEMHQSCCVDSCVSKLLMWSQFLTQGLMD